MKNINYEYFHWGPFLYKTKLTNKEINKIKKLCKKNNMDYRPSLAGLIKNEYAVDVKKLFPIIFPYLDSYSKAIYQERGLVLGNNVTLKSSWVNYMTKHEYNPIHSHSCDLSFVIYLNITKELKKEINLTISNNKKEKPGCITFMNKLSRENLNINSHHIIPEVGDFLIFPSNLNHVVNPFKSEGERVSISGNIELK